MNPIKAGIYSSLGLIGLILVASTVYTIDEGYVGIVKRFSEAQSQVAPGLHFKIPFVDTIVEMEIRTRKNVEKLPAATSEQMPVTAIVSVNWTVDSSQALDLYKKYGGLEQFENRILDPRLRSASKVAIAKFRAEQLIKERQSAISAIEGGLSEAMAGFAVSLDSVQLENIALPPKYLESIEIKQTAKNLADAEKFNLAKQDLVAQQDINIKKATAAGIDLVSIANAARIEREGIAEAAAIKAKAKALENNPLIVKLTHEQQWDGRLPRMMLGNSSNFLLGLDTSK